MKRWLLLFLALVLTTSARLWNWSAVFVDGQVYYVDADCYSRMTRVAAVLAHPGAVLRHHDFENWPIGTIPHTTVPLDYWIAALAWCFGNTDLAGAICNIFIALAATVVLWKWVGQFRGLTQIGVLLTFAICPILVHGTVLGRPDHQSLLIFLLIGAFAAEWEIDKSNPTRRNAILHGLAWGLALWTSLFEPLILLGATSLLGIAVYRKKWFSAARGLSWIVLGCVLLIALSIEHWHLGALPAGPLFDRWAKSIGELAPVGWWSITYLSWFSFALLVLPFAFFWQIFRRKNTPAILWGGLLLLTYILCTTAARWGYFMGIALLFALPFLLENARSRWVAVLFFLGFWPVAREWDTRLWPGQEERERVAEQREDYRELRQICQSIDPREGGGVLAPWWLSPPIAYWSGANCLAGSSHQSLPGTADGATFYLSRFPEKALEILRRRQVGWVLAYEPSRVLSTASTLLGQPAAGDALAVTIYQSPRRAPAFLQIVRETNYFRLYRVVDEL